MTLQSYLQQYHYEGLDPQQRAAVAATEGPVLLLAVPGSGKTTTLLARLGYLIYGRGVPPHRILTCTYTVAATNEMRTRFRAKFGGEFADQLEFRTINGVCARIISLYEQQGHTAFALITQDGPRYAILRQAWQDLGHAFPTDSDLRSMSTAITYIKNQMLTDTQADGVRFSSGEGSVSIGPIYRAYQTAMRRNRWMDYDDQMVYALSILKHCPAILKQLQDRYRYFSVDEAQDTSKIQHRVIAALASGSRNLLMVGDEDQSIYGFRAACPQMLMEFEQHWPGARVLFIEQNYRSTPQIVEAADILIRLNQARRSKRMQAVQPDGPAVQFQQCPSRAAQYECLASMAKEATAKGRQLAILYRNNDTALPILDQLMRQGISCRARGMDSLFFSSRIVRDVQNLFFLAFHPDDQQCFLQLYYKLGIYMKKEVAEHPLIGRGSVFQAYCKMPETAVPASLRHLLAERAHQLDQITRDNNPAAAIRTMTARMGYGEYLARNGMDSFRLTILELLAEQESSIAGFLHRLDRLQTAVQQGSGDPDACCILSTIHSSKGLEYDHVVLADAVIGVLPMDTSSVNSPEERQRLEEEERRLFYVGITRAKRELTIMDMGKSASPYVRYLYQRLQKPLNCAFPAAGQANIASSPKAGQKPADLSAFQPGCDVVHVALGTGTIQQRTKDYAVIAFSKHGQKKLSLPYAVGKGLLRVKAAAEKTQPEKAPQQGQSDSQQIFV